MAGANENTAGKRAEELGQNEPLTPMGAAEVGATPKSADMMGVPAQVQANIQMQQRAQEQRLQEQEQASAAEQQRLAGETLQQAKAYEKPVIPDQQPQAVKIAETLNTLGPVRTRIQSLIQERLQLAQTAATTLEVNEAAVAAIQDPAKRQSAQTALTTYITNPTELNLQAVYEAIGSEKTEDLQQFFTTPEGTIQESFQKAFGVNPTLGSLDLTAAGVNMADLASALKIPEAQLQNMTLDQLNQQIAAIEASELNRVDQLQAQLQDPTTSPAMREAIIAELQQLGASGVIEAETDVQAIQDQIDAANTVDILGREMTVEQLLSDEGLSSLVSQAVTDEEMLQALKDDPEYAALGNWIEQNKASLAVLAAEYEERGEEFVELQDKYKELKESFGADGLDLLKAIYGDELFSSVTTAEFEDFKAKLEANPFFRTLTKKGNEKYLAMVKSDPELRDNLLTTGYEDTEIETFFDIKEHFDRDPFFATLISGSADGIDFGEKGHIFDQDMMNRLRKMDAIERYDALPPEDIAANKLLQKSYEGDGVFLTLDEMENIAETGKSEELYADFTEILESNNKLNKEYSIVRDAQGNITGADLETLRKDYFGGQKFDADDLNAYLSTIDEDQRKEILAVFDLDASGDISESELNDLSIVDKLIEAMGIDDSKDEVIKGEGDWELGSVPGLIIPADAYETSIQKAADIKNDEITSANEGKKSDLTEEYSLDYGFYFVDNSPQAVKNVVQDYNLHISSVNAVVKSDTIKDIASNVTIGYTKNSNLKEIASVAKYVSDWSPHARTAEEVKFAKNAQIAKSVLSGSYLSDSDKKLLDTLLANGFGESKANGKLVSFGVNFEDQKRILAKLIVGYTATYDMLKYAKDNDYLKGANGLKRTDDIKGNLDNLKSLFSSLIPSKNPAIDQISKFNSFSKRYDKISPSAEYNSWYSLITTAVNDKDPAATYTFKKAKLTLKQLVAYANGEITIDKDGKVTKVEKPTSKGWL